MWWKLYFGIISFLFVLSSIGLLSGPIKHVYMAVIDAATFVFLMIGLYAYVFKKVIFSPILWKCVFWIALITAFLSEYHSSFPNSQFAPYLSYLTSVEPEPMNSLERNITYAITIPLIYPLFYAIFQISKDTWSKKAKKLKVQTSKLKTLVKSYKKAPTKLKKISKLKVALSVIGTFILSVVLFFVFCIWQAINQLPYVENMVDTYLYDMKNENYSSAYGLFSEEFKKHEDYNTFEKKRKDFKYGFKDYDSLESNSINVNYYFGQYPMINYSGAIHYTDGEQGRVTSTFIYVNNNWEMVEVFVIASPNRWQKDN